jgi:agmatine deiminase
MPCVAIKLPAEWELQAGTLLTWPYAHSAWQPWLTQVEDTFAELATQISRRQTVIINGYDADHCFHIQRRLATFGAQLERIYLYAIPSNDSWARDHGPITVYRDARPVLLDFRFNGWGEKFPYHLDNQITQRLYAAGAFGSTPLQSVELILEGGSIESDGQGTLLTTHRCLLSAHRNDLTRQALENHLRDLLGIERFFWLRYGQLSGDDTDGHIDTLARFCDPDTIAYQCCEDKDDEHFAALGAMADELRKLRTRHGMPYRLVPLPLPEAKFNADGNRLPAGYANFFILNEAVLVPTYDDPADNIALEQLRNCFPSREVIGINCLTLLQQYGSLHCVTMHLPRGVMLVRS